jgi:hypothetical protein
MGSTLFFTSCERQLHESESSSVSSGVEWQQCAQSSAPIDIALQQQIGIAKRSDNKRAEMMRKKFTIKRSNKIKSRLEFQRVKLCFTSTSLHPAEHVVRYV